jgi:hypothetical protein
LPPGATIVSVDLAGHSAKPASGADGTRIPLMRAGLPTSAPYSVSFVYIHAGTPFQKKGDIQMALPKMDVPIGVVNWEVFVPEQYSARAIDGNVIDARRFRIAGVARGGYVPVDDNRSPRIGPARLMPPTGVLPGQIRGRVLDNARAEMPGATVRIAVGGYRASTVADARGEFTFSGVPPGDVTMTAELAGFATRQTTFGFDGSPRRIELDLEVGAIQETITVTAESSLRDERVQQKALAAAPPSQNVVNLQARAAGVLPIRVDVPRAGISHEFIKPLVVGAEATVTLRYKRN